MRKSFPDRSDEMGSDKEVWGGERVIWKSHEQQLVIILMIDVVYKNTS